MKTLIISFLSLVFVGAAQANDKTCNVRNEVNFNKFTELESSFVLNPGHGNSGVIRVRSCANGLGKFSRLVIRGEKRAFNNWSPAWVDKVVVVFGNGNSQTLLEGSSYLSTYEGAGAIGSMLLRFEKERCVRRVEITGHSASGGQSMVSVWAR